MIPQILQQLGGGQNLTAMIKQAKQIIGAINNPQAAIAQIIQNNPAVSQVIRQYGGIDGAITALCQQKGINPHELMEALK